MKKIGKKAIVIIAIVAVLGVTILTLGLVRVRQDEYFFNGYNDIQVYNLSATSPFPSITEKIEPALNSVSFSVLSAMLEGQFGYKPTIIKNSDDEPVFVTANSIKNMAATGERYLLHFVYEDTRSITVEGEKYEFDRAFVSLPEGNGEIVDVRVLPYLLDRVYTDTDGEMSTEFYKVPDLRIKMRTSKLYVTIENAINEVLNK